MTTTLLHAGRLVGLLAIVLLLLATTMPTPAPAATAPASPAPGADLPLLHVAPRPTIDVHQAAVARVVERLDRVAERAHVAVSVLDTESGATFNYGPDHFKTASLVKIHLVALMSWRAERSGSGLSAAQRSDAEQMLVRSDNDAAQREYFALGARTGIERGLKKAFGDSEVIVGDHGYWGHTSTTPREVVGLLERVLDPRAEGTYALIQGAMSRVVPGQRWGISVLGDKGSTVQTKVGWFEDPDGWIANSSGRVIVDGSPVLISVMTDRNRTLEAGITTIEDVARLAGDVVREKRQVVHLQREAVPRPWLDLGARIRGAHT